ncbi:MAG: S-layer homology domain-containing protein [Acidimicrobiales bacterium]
MRAHLRPPLLVLAMLASLLGVAGPSGAADTVPPGGTFTDDDGNIHEDAIEAIKAASITTGCAPTRYCPDEPVTRGQMAAFLNRALSLPAATAPSGFTDTAGTFHDDIERLKAANITTGCQPTLYCTNQPVTRGQMAAFLNRALSLPAATAPSGFTDTAGTFHDDIERLKAANITTGTTPTTYSPDRPVTRAEMATFLTRALQLEIVDVPPRPLPNTGNPAGTAPVPAAAAAVDTTSPDVVIGNGSPAGCTSAAVVSAVAQGGLITFDCGPDPITIEMQATAKVVNDTGPEIVIDGGGLVTLSGGGERRILYMNTCDPAQVWTTSHCQNQDHPRLTVQNLTFVDGDATTHGIDLDGGGGAIWVRGGRFRIVNSRFFGNTCAQTGPDVAGGAVRVFSQYDTQPVYITNTTFGGGAAQANDCSNGGAIGSIGVSMTFINSLLTHNAATGWGANPQRAGTPGGGNGGAIANDGNTYTLTLIDTVIEDNAANEGGGGVFYVSNNRTGNLVITDSTLARNESRGFETRGYPGIFYLGRGAPIVSGSTLE